MRLGFSGSREGMSPGQFDAIEIWIIENVPNISEAHHGDCVGADAEFDELIRYHLPDLIVDIHPPLDPKYRAWCQTENSRIHRPLPYLDRNRVIVEESDWLLATPKNEKGGGTWYTINHAKVWGVSTVIVHRDSTVEVTA